MKTKLETAVAVFAVMVVEILLPTWVAAQDATRVSLQEQLAAQYKLAKVTFNSGGAVVGEPGTLLAIQQGGILSVPLLALAVCPAKFQDNTLHPPGGFCEAMVKSVSKNFQPGDKVYPIKIDVNVEKAKIAFTVVACDSCNGINPPASSKGEVVFQFAKGYLETANAASVEDTIGQVFSISDDGQQQARLGQPAKQEEQPAQAQPQTEPQTIQLGQTTDQVQYAFGKPEKIVDLGAKQIYVYKDLKVTFLNGKVTDVQ